MIRVSERF
ncbi:hypothetical protein D043_2009A, partial [Vibrio parahaemolyticus EKP-021]